MVKKEFVVNPWEVKGEVDYDKLTEKFGTKIIDKNLKEKLNEMHPLLRRGIYFSHRDFNKWISAFESKKRISVLTGRGPSERMHLGHLVPFLVAKSLQDKFNCEVFIPISDDEKFYVKKDLTMKQAIDFSNDNILDLIALGFNSKKTFIFEDFIHTDIYKFAAQCAKKITYSEAKAVFGLRPENNIGWSFYPAMQAAHILFPQFVRGKHSVVVPIGVDQDPFIRLTRDMAESFNFEKPSAIHAMFIPGLSGGAKMSSSDSSNDVIYLTDSPSEVKKKINKYAFSGGKDTVEEHRKFGGNPDVDVSFQYLRMFFEPNDEKLADIEKRYRNGELLSGELKAILIEKINIFLKEHQKKREEAKKRISEFLFKE
jgi:tryptophanyl-tRNA synthetase